MSTAKKIMVFPAILLFMWSSFICAAASLEFQHRNGMSVKEFDEITLRLSIDRINIEEILAHVKDINAPRVIIFVKHVKDGETRALTDSLKDRFPPSDFSRSSYGLGRDSLIVEIASHRRFHEGSDHFHFSDKYINKKQVMAFVGAPPNAIEKRIVWFFENTNIKKMRDLVIAIKKVQPALSRIQIATWLIGKKKGMIEIDWLAQQVGSP